MLISTEPIIDHLNPFNFNKNNMIIKKTIRKKRTMASIYQYLALSNIDLIAKAKDNNLFEQPDKDLYDVGVRPGQVWKLSIGSEYTYISCVGYHNKGFLIFNIRPEDKGPIPSISLFRHPRKTKLDLLEAIKSNQAILQINVIYNLINTNGNAKSGRELDVTLAALVAQPAYWHDPQTSKNYYLTICKDGHYRISEYFLESGGNCTKECTTSRNSIQMAKYLNNILRKIYYGKDAIPSLKILSLGNIISNNIISPFTIVESLYDTYKIIGGINNNIFPSNFIPNNMNSDSHPSWKQKMNTWLNESKIHSGQIFKIIFTLNKLAPVDYYIRLHRRTCGNIHIELSDNKIFHGEPDKYSIASLLSISNNVKIKFSDTAEIELSDHYPIVSCPICSNNGPVIYFSDEDLSLPIIVNSINVNVNLTKEKQKPEEGTVVLYKNNPVFFQKIIFSKHITRALIVTKNKKVSAVSIDKLKPCNSPEFSKIFLDNNLLVKRKFTPNKWYNTITIGSQLKINPTTKKPELQSLINKPVTVTNIFKSAKKQCVLKISESDTIVDVNIDVLPLEYIYYNKGMELIYKNKNWKIEDISNGSVTILENNKDILTIPEASLSLMLNRNLVQIKEIFTVENLLKETGTY